MLITVENDYLTNDNKGLIIDMRDYDYDDPIIVLIRIENEMIIWYESQNGEYICDSIGEYMTDSNRVLVGKFLEKQNPDCHIEGLYLNS